MYQLEDEESEDNPWKTSITNHTEREESHRTSNTTCEEKRKERDIYGCPS